MPTSTSAATTHCGDGATHHNAAVAPMLSTEKTISQGRRRPPRSAMAPSNGENTAIASAESEIAQPHCAVPVTGSVATPRVK